MSGFRSFVKGCITKKPYRTLAYAEKRIAQVKRENGTVLRAYCGSGTTGVACVQTGRNFIGIEIDPKYADIARRRIADAVPLFAQVEKPKQTQSEIWTP